MSEYAANGSAPIAHSASRPRICSGRDLSPCPRALLAELVSAAEVTFGDQLRAVVVKGSLVSHGGQDFLPFFSDVDCHLYLAPTAMRSAVTPRGKAFFRVQRQRRLAAGEEVLQRG